MLNEFKKFIMRGNVLDMAVGVIVGGAFGKIVDSLVKDVLMPPIGFLIGNVNFSNLFITLKKGKDAGPYTSLTAANDAGAITINIGLFINTITTFLIVAFAVFILIRTVNKIVSLEQKQKTEAAPTTKECPFCCTTININAIKCPDCTADLTK